MKIENKLLLPFGVFLISLLILSLNMMGFIEITKTNYQNIVDSDTRFDGLENVLAHYDLMRDFSFTAYVQTGDQQYLEGYRDYKLKSSQLYDELAENMKNPELGKHYTQRRELFTGLTTIERGIIEAKKQGTSTDAIKGEEYQRFRSELKGSMDLPKEFYTVKVKDEMVKNIESASTHETIMLMVIILTGILLLIEYIFIKMDVINPLKKLDKVMDDKRNLQDMADFAMVAFKDKEDKKENEIEELKNMVKLATIALKNKDKGK